MKTIQTVTRDYAKGLSALFWTVLLLGWLAFSILSIMGGIL